MQKSPIIMVSSEVNIAAIAAISAVRSALWLILYVPKVGRTSASFAGTTVYFYVVNEIRFGHRWVRLRRAGTAYSLSIIAQISAKMLSIPP